jgi:signal transduction histidine kinase
MEAGQPSTLQPTVIRFNGQDKWDYTAPADLLFSYKLDETPWTPYSNIASRAFQNLSSGSHTLQVLVMDRNGNRSPAPAEITFSVIVPWFKDPRLLFVSALAGSLTIVLAGFAVNKHLQLKRSYAEVEQIVAERTSELEKANRELLHGQKMRAIGTMAAGVAHDFNNILSIIKGSAQIIESNPNDKEKIRTRVNRIQTVVEQGTTIVKALLGLGRVGEKDLAPCDLAALLHETRRLLADRFPESVEIHIDAAPGLPRTLCAQEVLQQMLLNLILNAVDAIGGEGLVLLKLETTATLPRELVLDPAPTTSYLIVSVIDEGVGIAPENVSRIFEPFFTTKAFSSRRGTGLGLSMVYELAKGFGYGLNVQTKPGEGSSFSIILPVTDSSPPPES